DPVSSQVVHEELDGIPECGKDDDAAVGMVFELFPDKAKDDGWFGMKLVVPAARLVIECAKGRVLTQPLAGLAPSRAHPFGDQLCHVAFEHFTSLRFGKSHGMFEFHALSVYRGSRVSCRVPVLDPLLDLRI